MEKELSCLKSGFLMKWVIKRWRICWFTLHEDELRYHPKRDKLVVLESIPLQGASVVCPCLNEPNVNIDYALKLISPNGKELLMQAAGIQERDRWAHAIGAVIRSISSSSQVSSHASVPFQNFRVKANVTIQKTMVSIGSKIGSSILYLPGDDIGNVHVHIAVYTEVLGALQDIDAGVEMTSHIRNGIVHKNCFKGSDIIDWLLRWNIVSKRNDGIGLAQSLLKLGHLQEVDVSDGSAGASQCFKDDDKLYRFTSLNLGIQRNSYFDSSDSDSTLSDDEDDTKIGDKVKKGKIVKAGFLCKKKSLRKGWRFVRVTLRENPALLQYECPYKKSKKEEKSDPKLCKYVYLRSCLLTVSSKSTSVIGDIKNLQPSPKLRIYIKSKGHKCCTFQLKDEDEWFEYISLLQSLCGSSGEGKTSASST